MFLDGRPPVNVGVTSGGDLFGGTQVTFTDVLGDKQFNIYAASVSQYRTLSFSYLNLSRRFQYALQGYSQTQFFYGQLGGTSLRPGLRAFIRPRSAIATQTVARRHDLRHLSAQPLHAASRCRPGSCSSRKQYNDPALQDVADEYQQEQYGRTLFGNGTFMPLGVNLVQETTVFREYGPLGGQHDAARLRGRAEGRRVCSRARPSTPMRATTCGSAPTACWLPRPRLQELGRLPRTTCSSAATPRCAGTTTCEFLGNKGFFANAELRFPLIEAMRDAASACSAASAACSSSTSAAAGSTTQRFKVWDTRRRGRHAALGYASTQHAESRRSRRPAGASRLPARRRPRVVRHRPRDLRARLPDPLRLVVAHALQQGVGRPSSPTTAVARFARRASRLDWDLTDRNWDLIDPDL